MLKRNENGRSMVEMLGVLAIIGVLSIGGIAGYMIAMNRWKANNIINSGSVFAVLAMQKEANGGTPGQYYSPSDLGLDEDCGESICPGGAYVNGDEVSVDFYTYDSVADGKVINTAHTIMGSDSASGATLIYHMD